MQNLHYPTEDGTGASEKEQKRRQRISAGMRRSVAHGRPIGRPKEQAADIVAKYPAVVQALQARQGVRAAARETGVSVNTVQKVRAALAVQKTPPQTALVLAAQAGDQTAFESLVGLYRNELLVHCYRMLGSLHDAEDLVQETLLRAWEKRSTLTSPDAYRAWLYRIATNLCLNTLARVPRRSLPSDTYPHSDPGSPLSPPSREPIWLEPFPDDLLDDQHAEPEEQALQRERLTLAFMVALQHLTPMQRTILLLREVLEWPAVEVAEWINLSVPAVNSALQRARHALRPLYEESEAPIAKPQPQVQSLLERCITLWEQTDIPGLVALLREDAWFSMPPVPTWFQGRTTIGAVLSTRIIIPERQMRLLPVRANGSPAFAVYQRMVAEGAYHFVGLFVLGVVGEQIGSLVAFLDFSSLSRFALPPTLPSSS